ncbi:MAG: hypothetical protein EOP56_05675 [Sphingobacteriales bacterium]|nr:MAG: hypothetical protein EOP56_05675 [Sphingobacteriales bacterium]
MIKLLHEVQLKSLDILNDERITNKRAGLTSVANEYVVKYRAEKAGTAADKCVSEQAERKVKFFHDEVVELQRELVRDIQNKN